MSEQPDKHFVFRVRLGADLDPTDEYTRPICGADVEILNDVTTTTHDRFVSCDACNRLILKTLFGALGPVEKRTLVPAEETDRLRARGAELEALVDRLHAQSEGAHMGLGAIVGGPSNDFDALLDKVRTDHAVARAAESWWHVREGYRLKHATLMPIDLAEEKLAATVVAMRDARNSRAAATRASPPDAKCTCGHVKDQHVDRAGRCRVCSPELGNGCGFFCATVEPPAAANDCPVDEATLARWRSAGMGDRAIAWLIDRAQKGGA